MLVLEQEKPISSPPFDRLSTVCWEGKARGGSETAERPDERAAGRCLAPRCGAGASTKRLEVLRSCV